MDNDVETSDSSEQKARQLEHAGDYAAAYLAYAQVWREQPESVAAAERAGMMAERSGRFIAAAKWYATALSLPGARNFVWYAYGRVLEELADWHRAGYAYRQYAQGQRGRNRPVYAHQGGKLPLHSAIRHAALARPEYAHSVRHAAKLAQKLQVPVIRVAEFGVASGRGLLSLEEHAAVWQEITGVEIQVWGFDTGKGLPDPVDYKDIPHFFGGGDYAMQDQESLLDRLENAQLVIGDAAEKVHDWLSEGPPIGALFFDMDFYSSTVRVLDSMTDIAPEEAFLPRVSMTFDDVGPNNPVFYLKDYSDLTGESAAIADFNAANKRTQITSDKYFTALPEHAPWHDACFIMHRFGHPQYGTRIREGASDHLALDM